MVLALSDREVWDALDLAGLVPVVDDALVEQAAGNVERPDRPHYPVTSGAEVDDGTRLAVPPNGRIRTVR